MADSPPTLFYDFLETVELKGFYVETGKSRIVYIDQCICTILYNVGYPSGFKIPLNHELLFELNCWAERGLSSLVTVFCCLP
jgi:hypothetical protein